MSTDNPEILSRAWVKESDYSDKSEYLVDVIIESFTWYPRKPEFYLGKSHEHYVKARLYQIIEKLAQSSIESPDFRENCDRQFECVPEHDVNLGFSLAPCGMKGKIFRPSTDRMVFFVCEQNDIAEQKMMSIGLFTNNIWLQHREYGTHEFQGAYAFTAKNELKGVYWGNIFDPNQIATSRVITLGEYIPWKPLDDLE